MGIALAPLLWLGIVFGVIYVLKRGLELMDQFVRNQERVADSLETIARKLNTGGKT